MSRIWLMLALIAAGFVMHAPGAHAANGCVSLGNADAGRLAIVIGNATYPPQVSSLATPANDARGLADVFVQLGFAVVRVIDGAKATVDSCVEEALRQTPRPEIVVLSYSGHAAQIQGRNFLVANDVDVSTSPPRGLVALQPLVEKLQSRASATLVFLDACQENTLSPDGALGLSVSTGRAIAPSSNKTGTNAKSGPAIQGIMVAYATPPNTVCGAPKEAMSPFSQALIETIPKAGLSVQQVMSRVTEKVGESTLWAQTPWVRISLTGEVKLAAKFSDEDVGEISANWAAKSAEHLRVGRKREAIAAALKGLPKNASQADIERFPKAFEALTNAYLSGVATIPIEIDSALTLQSADKTYIAASTKEPNGYASTIWDAASRKQLFETLGGAQAGWPYYFSDSERLIAQTRSKSRTDIWSIGEKSKIASLEPGCGMSELGWIESAAFSPDDHSLLVDQGHLVVLYDFKSKPPKCRTLHKAAQQGTFGVAASFVDADRICLITQVRTGHATVQIIDLKIDQRTLLVETTLPTILYGVSVECSRSGRYASLSAVNAAGESSVEIWDRGAGSSGVATKAALKIPGSYSAQFSTDDAYLSHGGLSDARFIDLRTFKETNAPYSDPRLIGRKEGVFNANGKLIAGYAPNARTWLWKKSPTGPALADAAERNLDAAETASVAAERISWAKQQ